MREATIAVKVAKVAWAPRVKDGRGCSAWSPRSRRWSTAATCSARLAMHQRTKA
jgi:hypothetical protein